MSWEQITGGIGLFGGLVISALALRRSMAVDKISAQSGAANASHEGTAQIFAGLELIIDSLQDDNREFREQAKWMVARLDACLSENEVLKRDNARLRRKYGENS